MKRLLTAGAALFACSAVAVGWFLSVSRAADARPTEAPAQPPARLVAHEWGTFTSFSGSDGTPVSFETSNNDLPEFVYNGLPHRGDTRQNVRKCSRYCDRTGMAGTVSMETPVIYFYTDRPATGSVQVEFPEGWITDWYPSVEYQSRRGGLRWNFNLTPGESARFPVVRQDLADDEVPVGKNIPNPYYAARETDATPLRVSVPKIDARHAHQAIYLLEGPGGKEDRIEREKFLFYRGVGNFPPPVGVRALPAGRVRVENAWKEVVEGVVLVRVRDGKLSFAPVGKLEAGAATTVALPEAAQSKADLGALLVKQLTAAGLYEKEARAMVKTWDAAWFEEPGSRVLYLVPRSRTDELLPLQIEPKPTELVRVLVGRHDFLTPEQEAEAAKLIEREQTLQNEMTALQGRWGQIGRFADNARQIAAQRLQKAEEDRR
jgi:hypothetical protein